MASASRSTPLSEQPLLDLCDAVQAVADGRTTADALLQDAMGAADSPANAHTYLRRFDVQARLAATAVDAARSAALSNPASRRSCIKGAS